MPLPLALAIGAGIAGTIGVGTGIYGAAKMKEANDTMKSAESRHNRNIKKFEKQSNLTTYTMDNLGNKELEILESFERFTDIFERIHNKPEFGECKKDGFNIPKYDAEELKRVSLGAGILLGGIIGAAAGTAGGFAASGATTGAVMALGTASTGTAISTLSGAAATNATLAALGGGSLAAGGGGMALGTTILGATTLGVGLLVGGVIFGITGSSLSSEADKAWSQANKAEKEINKICTYLNDLNNIATKFNNSLLSVEKVYRSHLDKLSVIVNINNKTNWNEFTTEEKLITENTVLLVQLLFNMCKTQLVLVSENEKEMNTVNTSEVYETIENSKKFLVDKGLLY